MTHPPPKRTHPGHPAPARSPLIFVLTCLTWWAGLFLLSARVPAMEEFAVRLSVLLLRGSLSVLHIKYLMLAPDQIGFPDPTAMPVMQIVGDCSPLVPFLLLAGAVLAYPRPAVERLLGLLLGAALIVAFNTVRLLGLVAVLRWREDWFEFLHIYVWQVWTVLMILASFAVWIRIPLRRKGTRP